MPTPKIIAVALVALSITTTAQAAAYVRPGFFGPVSTAPVAGVGLLGANPVVDIVAPRLELIAGPAHRVLWARW